MADFHVLGLTTSSVEFTCSDQVGIRCIWPVVWILCSCLTLENGKNVQLRSSLSLKYSSLIASSLAVKNQKAGENLFKISYGYDHKAGYRGVKKSKIIKKRIVFSVTVKRIQLGSIQF